MKTVGILFLWMATVALGAPLRVVSLSTITMDIAKNVGGGDVVVTTLVKFGVDPHEFQPTPEDVKEIARADLVLMTGKGMEGYLAKLEESAGKAKFVDVGKKIPSLKLIEDGREVEDPHWWHSVDNMKTATIVVRDAMIQADLVHQADYEKDADVYLAKLDDLEKWSKEKIATLPKEKRKLVTSHDALQYFARDFGFTIYAIEGVNRFDEPSSKKIAELIKTIKARGVKAVFFEDTENPKVIREITRETGAKIGGKLYVDGLGSNEATTYVDMMKYNINTIVNSLK